MNRPQILKTLLLLAAMAGAAAAQITPSQTCNLAITGVVTPLTLTATATGATTGTQVTFNFIEADQSGNQYPIGSALNGTASTNSQATASQLWNPRNFSGPHYVYVVCGFPVCSELGCRSVPVPSPVYSVYLSTGANVSLFANPNPSYCGVPVTLKAVVTAPNSSSSAITVTSATGGSTGLTGQVQFFNNGFPLRGPVPVANDGTATVTVAASEFVNDVINGNQLTATYTSSGFQPLVVTSPVVGLSVFGNNSSISISPAGGSTYGQLVTLKADGVPAGATVTFTDNGTPIASGAATSFSTATLLAGNHSLGVSYSGSENSGCPVTLPYPVAKAPTTTTIQNPNMTCGAAAAVTATTAPGTTPLLPGVLPPTGNLDFSVNGSFLPGSPLSPNPYAPYPAASASVPISGSTSVTANYPGDSNYLPSSSTTATITPGTLTLMASSLTSVYGDPLTFTATSSTGGISQIGFQDGGATLPPGTGSPASVTIYSLRAGAHTVTATSGVCTSNPVTVTVAKATPATTITTPGPNSSTACISQTLLTAAVAPTGPLGPDVVAPSKDKTFLFSVDGAPAVPGVSSNMYSTLVLPPDQHKIQAVYPGDDNYTSSTSAAYIQTVDKPVLTLATPFTAVASDAAFSLTVSLSARPAANVTVTVTLFDNNVALPQVVRLTAQNPSVEVALSRLAPGTHTISASAPLCTGFPTVTAAPIIVTSTVNTSLALTAGEANLCQRLNLTATISPATATGVVAFYDVTSGRTPVGTSTLIDGTASISAVPPTAGGHQYEADYTPSDSGYASVSATTSITAAQAQTKTVLDVQPGKLIFGQKATLTASVSACQEPSAPAITGSIAFSDGSTELGSVPLRAGSAPLAVSNLSAGPHTLTAVYSGDSNFTTSKISVMDTVSPIDTTVTVTPTSSTTTFGQTVTFAATVTPSGATGKVVFAGVEGTQTGTISNGQAAFTTSATLAAGKYSLVATYTPDTESYSGSAASAVPITVNPAPTTINLSIPGSVVQGSPFTLTVNVTPAEASGAVTVSDGANTLGTVNLAGGVATLPDQKMSILGSHSLTASFASSDANYRDSSRSADITVLSALQITNPVLSATQPTALTAVPTQPYTFNFQATGGTPPYTWTASGAPPDGIVLATGGTLSGTSPRQVSSTFTVQVQDSSTPALTAKADISLAVSYPPLPTITVNPANTTVTPLDQPKLSLTLGQAYPFAVIARVRADFTPTVSVPDGYKCSGQIALVNSAPTDDCLSVSVPVEANSTSADVSVLTPGTVAGIIQANVISVTTKDGTALGLNAINPSSITIDKQVPWVTNATCTIDSATSFHIQVDGYSTPRDLKEADLTFVPASGRSLDTSTLPVPAAQWKTDPAAYFRDSNKGGVFTVILPGAAGDTSAIGSITVVLQNSVGASKPPFTATCGR